MYALINVFHSLPMILGNVHIGLKKKKKNILSALFCKRLIQSATKDNGAEQSTENPVPKGSWCRSCCIPAAGWQLCTVRSVQQLENALPL